MLRAFFLYLQILGGGGAPFWSSRRFPFQCLAIRLNAAGSPKTKRASSLLLLSKGKHKNKNREKTTKLATAITGKQETGKLQEKEKKENLGENAYGPGGTVDGIAVDENNDVFQFQAEFVSSDGDDRTAQTSPAVAGTEEVGLPVAPAVAGAPQVGPSVATPPAAPQGPPVAPPPAAPQGPSVAPPPAAPQGPPVAPPAPAPSPAEVLIAKFPKWEAVKAKLQEWEEKEQKRNDDTQLLVDKLTDQELKDAIIGGGWGNSGYVGWSKPMPTAGFKGLMYQDGPQGFRVGGFPGGPGPNQKDGDPNKDTMRDAAVALPACGAVANSWCEEHALVFGWAMGDSFHHHEAHVILGPGVQLWKNQENGRNFEYLGGEDPVMGAFLTNGMVRAMTAHGTLSTLKHYNYNDWETNRNTHASNADVPIEASMELFVKPFVAGIAAGSQSVMCGYNEADGIAMCGNKEKLTWLNQLSRRFFIMTDWKVHTTPTAQNAKDFLTAGLHQEQPAGGGPAWNDPHNHQILNMVQPDDPDPNVKKAKQEAAFRILAAAEDGKQLKDNPKLLKEEPCYKKQWQKNKKTQKKPSGDQHDRWLHLAKMLAVDAMVLLKNAVDGDRRILPLRKADTLQVDPETCSKDKMYLSGGGSGIVGGQTYAHVPDGTAAMGDKKLVKVKEKPWEQVPPGPGGSTYKLTCRTSNSKEDADRTDADEAKSNGLSFGKYYTKGTIDAKTIVFLSTPGQIPMENLLGAGAILYSLFPGQRTGHAVADVLTGVYQPMGHLAYTLFNKLEDFRPDVHQYKGGNFDDKSGDGLLLGYRQHQVHKKDGEAFPFGFGLPYFPKNMEKWEDLIQVDVKVLNLAVRGIYFCVTNKLKKGELGHEDTADIVGKPSPVVQFYVKIKARGHDFLELLTFRKIRELEPEKTECRIAFFDPVAVWVGDNKTGKFREQSYQKEEWELWWSLNGWKEAKQIPRDGGTMQVYSDDGGTTRAPYTTLKDYFVAYKERYAAEYLLWKHRETKKTTDEVKNLLLADLVDEKKDLEPVIESWEEMANRSKIKLDEMTGTWVSSGLWGQPTAR